MDNINIKKEKKLASNRLYSSFLIDNNDNKAVLKIFHESIDITVLAQILDDFIIVDPVNGLEGFSKIIKYQINDKNRRKFFIREFIEGDTLKNIVEEGRVSDEEIIEIGIAISDQIHMLEKMSLCHHSLKPDNIIIDADRKVHILDAFINKIRYPDMSKYSDLDNFDLCFMPPEYFIKESALDILSDIYSIGCLLYYALTKSPPYFNEEKDQIIKNHIWGSFRDDMSYGDLIHNIISPDRDSRPQSVKELKLMLESYRPRKSISPEAKSRIKDHINHTIIHEMLMAGTLKRNISIKIPDGENFSEVIIYDGKIRHIEYNHINDSFLYYLVKRGVFPNTMIDELFPYINNKLELLNHINTIDFTKPDEIQNNYKKWLSEIIVNEIIHMPNTFTEVPVEKSTGLPDIDGIPVASVMKSIFEKHKGSIIDNYQLYSGSIAEYRLKLTGLDNMNEGFIPDDFEKGLIASMSQEDSLSDLNEIYPDNREKVQKSVLEFLFKGLLSLQAPDSKEPITANHAEPSLSKPAVPGSLRNRVEKKDSPEVKIIRPTVHYIKPSEEQASEELHENPEVQVENISDSSYQQASSDKRQDPLQGSNMTKEQKTVIAATLLQEAKDYYGNILFSKADESITEALKIAPGNPVLLLWKAKILERIPEEFENAKRYFEKALGKDPNNPDIVADYSLYLCKTGNKRKALEMIKRLPQNQRTRELAEIILKEKGSKGFLNKFFQK